jgi:hypothetical protein
MTRMLALCLVPVCLAAVSHLTGCAAPDPAPEVSDPALTPDELAALPDAAEPDHDGLDAVIAAEPPETDAATFDTDDAAAQADVAVEDTDGTAATARIQPAAAVLEFGLRQRSARRRSCHALSVQRRWRADRTRCVQP